MNSRVTSFGNGSRLAFIKDSKNQPIESIEETERNIFTDIDYKICAGNKCLQWVLRDFADYWSAQI
jgi:hypothetical protein